MTLFQDSFEKAEDELHQMFAKRTGRCDLGEICSNGFTVRMYEISVYLCS